VLHSFNLYFLTNTLFLRYCTTNAVFRNCFYCPFYVSFFLKSCSTDFPVSSLFLLSFYTHTFNFITILGDFEIFLATCSVTLLGFIIYNVINCFSFRDLLKRFGFLKISRRDFYECGFRPTTQKVIRLPIQFILICVFFLLYDIELIFLFPYVSAITFVGLYDFLLLILFFTAFFLSLIIDFNRHALL